jgi:outer membrane protein W
MAGNDVNFTANAELGLLSKVYFPIRKYNISPYVGAGISRVFTSSSMDIGDENVNSKNIYWNKMLLIGISWYVGPGSWDFGTQLGNNFNLTLGYTFSF